MRRAIISFTTFSLVVFFYKCFNSEIVKKYLNDTINFYKKNKNICDKIIKEKKKEEESPTIKGPLNSLSDSITGIRKEGLREILKEIKKVEDRNEILNEKKEKKIEFSEKIEEIKSEEKETRPRIEIELELDSNASEDSDPEVVDIENSNLKKKLSNIKSE